ncbi:MAG: hypothetical protein AAF889_08095 [Cyanobacteria bacterium P01_D01_bin.73]
MDLVPANVSGCKQDFEITISPAFTYNWDNIFNAHFNHSLVTEMARNADATLGLVQEWLSCFLLIVMMAFYTT